MVFQKIFRVSLFLIVFLFGLFACSRREVIPVDDDHFVGFKFFLFADFNGEKYQGNGDAVIVQDGLFKFRVYDNLLGKHVMSFEIDGEGTVEVTLLLDDMIYEYRDEELALIMTHYLYALFGDQSAIGESNDEITTVTKNQSNRVEQVDFDYGGELFRLNIMKYFNDGDPRRISIENETDSVIFDITEFQDYDYPSAETDGFTHYIIVGQKTFFEWLGDAYGR